MGFKLTIKNAIETTSQIVEGVKNNIIINERIESLHEERISICHECVGVDKNGNKKLGMEQSICSSSTYHKHNNNLIAGCGCFLEIKTRSEEAKCPIEKW